MSAAKELFLDALDRPESERAGFVAARCADDGALREDVERLLAAHEVSRDVFGAVPTAPSGARLGPGDRVGAFTLVERLGEGGFATVWRAQQTEPVRRDVALKVLKAGMDTEQVLARFEAEQQALALMEHPGIAKVFDGGRTGHGRPWFAMELVDGEPITVACARHGLDKRARLEVFLDVCRAVQHAHQKGVIHRDLKPSNVLVTEQDGRLVPKVIDFGIAKAIQTGLTGDSIHTIEGQLLGTPASMSPEQIEDGLDVDTRCDVYGLGALLYELLAGVRPFEDTLLAGVGLTEILRVLREVDPPRPSTRTVDQTGLGRRELRGDLDWIVMRCLEKDRERRYDSAAVLANDIERHLAGEPVLAGPPDLAYRSRKFIGRHLVGISVAAVIIGLLVGGILVSLQQLFRARTAEADLGKQVQQTRTELEKYEQVSLFYESILTGIDPSQSQGKDTELFRDLLASATRHADTQLLESPQVEATVRRAIGLAYLTIARLDDAEPQLRRAVELRKAHLEVDDPLRYESLQELGVLLIRGDRFEDALPVVEAAVEGLRRTRGMDDPYTLRALGDRAVLHRELGELEAAEALLREVLAGRIALHGERHADTIPTLNNLAGAVVDLGRPEEAATLYRSALELQVELQGPLHPQTLMALNNYGSILQDLGRMDEALPFYEEALRRKRDVFSDGHESLIVSLNNLAHLHEQAGRLDEASGYYTEALEMLERTDGESTSKGIQLRFNHAVLLERQGASDRSLAELARCVALATERFGPRGPLTRMMENAHAWQLVKLGRASEAEPVLRRTLEAADGKHPPGDPTPGMYRLRLGVALRDLDRPDEARPLLEAGLATVRAAGLANWIEVGEAALASLDD